MAFDYDHIAVGPGPYFAGSSQQQEQIDFFWARLCWNFCEFRIAARRLVPRDLVAGFVCSPAEADPARQRPRKRLMPPLVCSCSARAGRPAGGGAEGVPAGARAPGDPRRGCAPSTSCTPDSSPGSSARGTNATTEHTAFRSDSCEADTYRDLDRAGRTRS
jgi:hypothetical protein